MFVRYYKAVEVGKGQTVVQVNVAWVLNYLAATVKGGIVGSV